MPKGNIFISLLVLYIPFSMISFVHSITSSFFFFFFFKAVVVFYSVHIHW